MKEHKKKFYPFIFFVIFITWNLDLNIQASPSSTTSSQGEKLAIDLELKFPANLLLLDNTFSHHVAIAEKSTHLLHLFQNQNGYPYYLKSYKIATGKTAGNKSNSGDLKTPEGIYQLTSFLNDKQLYERYGLEAKMYGAGAFVLNYPNMMDLKLNKTGSGIWLHSTDDETRISKGLDSKGCVVVSDRDIKDISQYIELENTSLIIVQDLFFLRKQTWEANRDGLKETIQQWLKSWQDENINDYMSFYHQEAFTDPLRKNYNGLKHYKAAVFMNPGRPKIKISNISILTFNDYTVVQLQQDYLSNTIDDTGKKTLYLKRDRNYQWKIVVEIWSKIPNKSQMAFTPSMRFFTEYKGNSKDI